MGERPGDRYAAETDWADILIPAGWTLVRGTSPDGIRYWRRPGKCDGSSATTRHSHRDTLYVFSTNAAPFEPDESYTKLGAYTMLHHNGNYSAAARALAQRYRMTLARQGTHTKKPTTPYVSPLSALSALPERVNVVRLSDVAAEPTRWLWPGYIPLGAVTIIDGDPGVNKSTLVLDIAARISNGRTMPDESQPDLDGPRGTVLLALEDSVSRTLRPRFDAAEGDPWRVLVLQRVTRDGRSDIPTIGDIQEIRSAIENVQAAIVVVDPIMAHLPDGTNSHRDNEMRRALLPLSELAAEMDVAVIVIRHLTKPGPSERAPIYRGGGSIGMAGAARSVLMVAPHPDGDESRRVLAPVKNSLARLPPSWEFKALTACNGVAMISWEQTTDLRAADLGKSSRTRSNADSALAAAEKFLLDALRLGERPEAEVEREAREAGISTATLRRARTSLGVKSRKDRHCWRLSLPKPVHDE